MPWFTEGRTKNLCFGSQWVRELVFWIETEGGVYLPRVFWIETEGGVYLPSSYPDCASTVHKLTFSPVSSEATAQVFLLHPLAEGSRKASRPAMQSGTCLACTWAHKRKMSMGLLCTPGFFKSRQAFLEEEISAVLFPEISQLGVARVSESSLPLSTHTQKKK